MEPGNSYKNEPSHLVAVDSIIFGFDHDELKILLVKRPIDPLKGQWSLMGGFVQDFEDVDAAAQSVLFKLTGLKNVFLEQLYTFGNVNRDIGGRVISVAYYALIRIHDYDELLAKQYEAEWCKATDLPPLVFDHKDMVTKAIETIRRKCRIQPVGFELLQEKFTIPQLQNLYEAILMKKLDKRNFRKKMLSMNLLDKLTEKEKSGSKKGAYLYQFNRERYFNLTNMGLAFEL